MHLAGEVLVVEAMLNLQIPLIVAIVVGVEYFNSSV
jgi:hypothetical protein